MRRRWQEISLGLKVLLGFFVAIGLLRVGLSLASPPSLADPSGLAKLASGLLYLGGGTFALRGDSRGLVALIVLNGFILLLVASALVTQGPAAVGPGGVAVAAFSLFCVVLLSAARRRWSQPGSAHRMVPPRSSKPAA